MPGLLVPEIYKAREGQQGWKGAEGAWEVVMLASSPGQRAGTQLAAQQPVVLL